MVEEVAPTLAFSLVLDCIVCSDSVIYLVAAKGVVTVIVAVERKSSSQKLGCIVGEN
jgi:hypothetical protein